MDIPEGYSQVTLGFSGTFPYPPAVTFGIDNPDVATPAALGILVRTAWESSGIEPLIPNTIQQDLITVKMGPSATGPSATITGAGLGGSTAAAATPQVAILVQKQTGFGGRSGKGRFYLPIVQEASVAADGTLLGGYITPLQTAMTSFLNNLESADIPMVVFHNPGAPLSAPTPVDSLVVQSRVATQRRRNRR